MGDRPLHRSRQGRFSILEYRGIKREGLARTPGTRERAFRVVLDREPGTGDRTREQER